jgi:hypothetical protein
VGAGVRHHVPVKVVRLRVLLVVWVVLAVVPGLVATAAYDLDTGGLLGGGAAGIWVGGYLVQFGVFMWVARIAGSPTVLGAVTASLLPWVCDWACPAGLWIAAPCAAVAAAVAYWMYSKVTHKAKLEQRGIPATGTVLEVVEPRWNVVINSVYIRRTLRLKVSRSDGAAPYEARLKDLFMLGEIPNVGDRVQLRIDPKDPQHLIGVNQPDETPSAPSAAANSDWLPTPGHDFESNDVRGDARPEPMSAQVSPQASGSGFDGIADELAKLDKLHRAGGLSDHEFEQAKARVLDG